VERLRQPGAVTPPTTRNLLVALATTVVVGLTLGPGWWAWLAGAVYALALAVGVWVGSGPSLAQWRLAPRSYAVAAAVALVVGLGLWWLTGADNGAFVGVGVVLGITTSISVRAAGDEQA